MIRKIKKLGVCGASWACRDTRYPKTHFTEMLANHFGCDYINYALPGCSNDVIGLQIQEAINSQCNALVVQVEMPDRITFPYPGKAQMDFNLQSVKSRFPHIDHPFDQADKQKSYYSVNHTSVIEGPVTITGNEHIQQNYKTAMKDYVNFLYSDNKQSVVDSWIFSYFLTIAINKSIMLCVIIDQNNPIRPLLKHLGKNILQGNKPFEYQETQILLHDPVYHTDLETQQKTFQLAVKHYDKY